MKSTSSDDSSEEESEEDEPPKKEIRQEKHDTNVDDKIKRIISKNTHVQRTPTSSVTKFYELKAGRELTTFDASVVEDVEDSAMYMLS